MTSERASGQPEEAGPAEEARPPGCVPEEVYSDDEAEVIAERLAALGYIE
jgi:hypothetical protein